MKRLTILLLVLLMVCSISWTIDFGGSTAIAGVANADAQRVEVDQDIDIDIGPLHIDLAGGLDYDGAVAADYSVGASVGFFIFTIGGSVAGDKDIPLGDVKANLDVVAGVVGADVDVLLSADAEKEVFQGAEFSAFWNPGPLELRVGYLLTTEGAGEINAPEVFDDGGIYATAKITY